MKACLRAFASFSVSAQMMCGLMMVRTLCPASAARCLMDWLWVFSSPYTSAPAGRVMNNRSECLAAKSTPAPLLEAFTMIGRPFTGFGETKPFFIL